MSLTTCQKRIDVRTPSTQMISPEAIGKRFMGEASVFSSQGTLAEVDLENEQSDNPLLLSESPSLLGNIGGNAEVGAFTSMDVVIRSTGDDAPIMAGLKYQIFGDPRVSAKRGNHSLAIVGLFGMATKDERNDDAIELTPQDEEVDTQIDIMASDVSLIYGYRIEDTVLAYIGSTYSTMSFKGELESDKNATLDGKEIDYSGHTTGANLGLMIDLGRLVNLKLEGSHQKVNWEKTDPRSFNYVSIGVGFNWY